jgi:primosomal protein N' (replication factor Y)
MLYAKIVVGLPVEGPFDYSLPDTLKKGATCGIRTWVNFGGKKAVGYVVGLSTKTKIKKVKPILGIIDSNPILSAELLSLTRELAAYYCCSWGEAIEAALPQALRKGKELEGAASIGVLNKAPGFSASLLFCPHKPLRLEHYLREIKKAIDGKLGVIVVLADKHACADFKKEIESRLQVRAAALCRNEAGELNEWLNVRAGDSHVAVGTRSAVFAPFEGPGLIILDEEENTVYKQEQVPHYHAREAALVRAKISESRLILGSSAPSLESFYLASSGKIGYDFRPGDRKPSEVKLMDASRELRRNKFERPLLSKYLSDCISAGLAEGEKILLFLNRRGFATSAACHNCRKTLVCPRCNTSLVYFYENDTLACAHCNFRQEPPKICPQCNSGYIKFRGAGAERIESELSRIFPQARVRNISGPDETGLAKADIFVATSAVFKKKNILFDLVGVLDIDSALNRQDFRSAEKVFAILQELRSMSVKKMIIQTGAGSHPLFEAIVKNKPEIFYDAELKERRQLGYPPYRHIILIKLRSRYQDRAKRSAEAAFDRLNRKKPKGIDLVSVNPSIPAKLRGNYYWQVMLKSTDPEKAARFIKLSLKDFRHSGIIVTVDVDPA